MTKKELQKLQEEQEQQRMEKFAARSRQILHKAQEKRHEEEEQEYDREIDHGFDDFQADLDRDFQENYQGNTNYQENSNYGQPSYERTYEYGGYQPPVMEYLAQPIKRELDILQRSTEQTEAWAARVTSVMMILEDLGRQSQQTLEAVHPGISIAKGTRKVYDSFEESMRQCNERLSNHLETIRKDSTLAYNVHMSQLRKYEGLHGENARNVAEELHEVGEKAQQGLIVGIFQGMIELAKGGETVAEQTCGAGRRGNWEYGNKVPRYQPSGVQIVSSQPTADTGPIQQVSSRTDTVKREEAQITALFEQLRADGFEMDLPQDVDSAQKQAVDNDLNAAMAQVDGTTDAMNMALDVLGAENQQRQLEKELVKERLARQDAEENVAIAIEEAIRKQKEENQRLQERANMVEDQARQFRIAAEEMRKDLKNEQEDKELLQLQIQKLEKSLKFAKQEAEDAKYAMMVAQTVVAQMSGAVEPSSNNGKVTPSSQANETSRHGGPDPSVQSSSRFYDANSQDNDPSRSQTPEGGGNPFGHHESANPFGEAEDEEGTFRSANPFGEHEEQDYIPSSSNPFGETEAAGSNPFGAPEQDEPSNANPFGEQETNDPNPFGSKDEGVTPADTNKRREIESSQLTEQATANPFETSNESQEEKQQIDNNPFGAASGDGGSQQTKDESNPFL
eukprot:TRINITY_DN8923_c0_g1_i1.p1 TRINITY_DN8923_c0_g1~~TRINITY_DN8923_c0_g1_i1.p1  ORF type:complete len:756 (-),score=163.90 TRINITY_DN8923_c0_g1_i1:138-2174(-)